MPPVHNAGRSKKRLTERLRLAMSRVSCFLWTEKSADEPLRGFGFVSDISEEGCGFYLNVSLPKSTLVRVALEDEASLPYRGVVLWSRRYNLEQRFHGQETLDYRIGVQFFFDSESDRQRYLIYFNDLRARANFLSGTFKF